MLTVLLVLFSLIGIALIILGWPKVYDSKDELATTGVYKYVRHPEYLGIILLTGGRLIHWPTIQWDSDLPSFGRHVLETL
jgi:protein-S-isoprenylcysteine O-methyltransferase Ste14